MRFKGFIGPSYQLSSVNVDCQRCINLFPELNEMQSGKEGEIGALLGTPGLRLLVTVGAGPIRGLYTASNGRLFCVSYNKLYEISSSWVATERGTLTTNAGTVSIADNGIHLVLVDGTKGFVLTFSSNAYAEITDEDWEPADQVTFQDGYFIFNVPDSGRFQISGLNAVDFDALDISTAEGSPDNLVGLISDHRELWLFGEQSTEVFFNSGNADFPFERISGAFIEHGCAARFSIAKGDNRTFWLGKDARGQGIVYVAQGYQPQRISTHAVEHAISGYGDLSNTTAYTYQDGGHLFYVLNFENASTTWVFDSSTGLWHERVYKNQGVEERHRAENHALAFATHVVGDYENGKLYEMTRSYYSDAGVEIMRRRISPHLSASMKRVTHKSFQLDIETGTGLDGSGQGTDPQAMLQFSDDGGHTWSNEKWTDMGRIGQTKVRCIWRRLGSARDRVYRITISDPVKVAIVGAEIDVEQEAS